MTALTPATAAKLAETCSGDHVAKLAANGECSICGAHHAMTAEALDGLAGRSADDSENLAELMRNAGVIELPDAGDWIDTGTGPGYSGTAWNATVARSSGRSGIHQ